MPWYKTGTVSCTQNSNAVIGAGTSFIANCRVGDLFRGPDGALYEVTNVASDTAMSISPVYQGASVSAGGYALAPIQGYVKDSADALRTLVNKFGALAASASINAFAALTGGTGKIPYFTAADKMAVANITDLAYAKSNILGTVSQSAGIPTGAVIERGSTASGDYVKFADGTLICTSGTTNIATPSYGANTNSNIFTVTFAANFFNSSFLFIGIAVPSASYDAYGATGSYPASSSSGGITIRNGASAQSFNVRYVAIGRWF